MEVKKKRTSVEWSAHEHEHREKDFGWYALIMLFTLAFFSYALWRGNLFFAFFIVIAGALIIEYSRKPPQHYEFKIDNKGVTVGHKFHAYEQLTNFSIRYFNGHPRELVIRKKTAMNPFMHLPAERHMILAGKEVLEEKLPEVEFVETFADIFADFLGF